MMLLSFTVLVLHTFQLPATPWLREAEKKHERVALLALPSLGVIAAATGEDPVPWLSHQPVDTQLVFFSTAALVEAASLRRFEKGFRLKDSVVPGVWGARNATPWMEELEDGAGRVAMLATTGALGMSLLAGSSI